MIPILMYQQIGQPAPKGAPYRGLTVHPADFRRQMIWLRRFGYRGLSMRELLPYVRGERQGKVVGITFDDGYRNVYQNALPVLNEQGFTATNYFVARQLDGGNVWDYEKGIPHSDLMSAQEMRAWAAAGMEVGSHTLDHRSEEHTSELQSLMRISYAVFCLKKKKIEIHHSIRCNTQFLTNTKYITPVCTQ